MGLWVINDRTGQKLRVAECWDHYEVTEDLPFGVRILFKAIDFTDALQWALNHNSTQVRNQNE